MRASEIDLPRECIELLKFMVDSRHDGTLTAHVKETSRIPWATESHHVTYRWDQLEEAGYVQTRRDPERATGSEIPPRVGYVTEQGRTLAADVEVEPEEQTLSERVKRLEKQAERIGDNHGSMKERFVTFEGRIGELESEYESLREDVERLKTQVDEGEASTSLAEELRFD